MELLKRYLLREADAYYQRDPDFKEIAHYVDNKIDIETCLFYIREMETAELNLQENDFLRKTRIDLESISFH
jgi:hypothetical protein